MRFCNLLDFTHARHKTVIHSAPQSDPVAADRVRDEMKSREKSQRCVRFLGSLYSCTVLSPLTDMERCK